MDDLFKQIEAYLKGATQKPIEKWAKAAKKANSTRSIVCKKAGRNRCKKNQQKNKAHSLKNYYLAWGFPFFGNKSGYLV